MARVLKSADAIKMAHDLFPSFLRQRERVQMLDGWTKGIIPDDQQPFMPKTSTREYGQVREIANSPWLGFIVTSLVQTIFLEGVRMPGKDDNLKAFRTWQRNGWDARQTPLYRAAMSHGAAFAVALPGKDPLTSDKMAVMRGVSAKRMAAFYDDDDTSNWATSVIEAVPYGDPEALSPSDRGWTVRLYDEVAIYSLSCKGDGEDLNQWTYISYEEHEAGVPPVVRYPNSISLDGDSTSEIEPLIPLARRIDQDTFDRLIVQRFGAWKVRYIAGLAKPEDDAAAVATALRLRVEDLLISENAETKFGTLDATDIAGFLSARDSDLRDLSAISQTPPHHMLGLSSNLQAESLAAAEAGLQRKSIEHKTLWGECHEQLFRLTAKINGDIDEVNAYDMQVRWRDMESRSLSQAADALSKLADGLGVPREMLWERIPNWTDLDTERAKALIQDGAIDELLARLTNQAAPRALEGQQPPQPDTGVERGGRVTG